MKNVSKTMYIPLYGKAYVSRKNIILNDPTAEAIWAQEGFPLRGKAKSKWLAYSMGMRSKVFDRWVQQKIEEQPDAVVLHIGCGMDSRAFRVKTSSECCWIDVDFPDVIEERKRYYQESETYRMMTGDARETGWIKALPEANTAIVVLEGLTMYLTPAELKQMLAALQEHFSQLHILMDCYTSLGAKASKYKNPINTVGVNQTYGMDDPAALAKETGFTFVKEHEMAPENLITELQKMEQIVFRKLFAGRFAKAIYRMYEFFTESEPAVEAIAKQAAKELTTAENLTAANSYFDSLTEKHPGFEKIASNLYRCNDILFNTGLRFTMESHARGLKAVQHFSFASAPKLLEYLPLQNGTHCVLITKIDGVRDAMPLPCTGAGWQQVTPQGGMQLIADAENLYKRNLINEAILDTRNWHVVPATGMIVLSDWSRLRQCSSHEEGMHMVNTVKQELSDRGLV